MIRGTKPDVCVYHGPTCLDGFAAAWAIHQQWPNIPYVPAKYGDDFRPNPGEHVLIVDFSFPEDLLREIAATAASVTVLDHHEGAKEHLLRLSKEEVINLTFADHRSGAGLAWEYVWPGVPEPRLISHVQDRDLWKFEIDGTREVIARLSVEPQEFEAWSAFASRLEDPGDRAAILREGGVILKAQARDIADVLKSAARTMEIGGHEVPVANVPYLWASEVGHILGEGVPFAATYFDREDGARVFSLRSGPEGADVQAIAKQYGGSGHVHAAGFTIYNAAPDMPEDGTPVDEAPEEAESVDEIKLNSPAGPIKVGKAPAEA